METSESPIWATQEDFTNAFNEKKANDANAGCLIQSAIFGCLGFGFFFLAGGCYLVSMSLRLLLGGG